MGINTFLQLVLQQPVKPLNNLIKMKVLAVLSVCVLGLASAAPGWYHGYRYKSHHMAKSAPTAAPAPRVAELPSIAAAAIATPSLTTLVTAVKAAGLVETLSGEGTFTVFAPNNDAFAKVPAEALGCLLEDKEALTPVLLRHVLPVSVKAGDIPAGSTVLKTVGGEDITVTNADGAVTIESNGVVATVIATIYNPKLVLSVKTRSQNGPLAPQEILTKDLTKSSNR